MKICITDQLDPSPKLDRMDTLSLPTNSQKKTSLLFTNQKLINYYRGGSMLYEMSIMPLDTFDPSHHITDRQKFHLPSS